MLEDQVDRLCLSLPIAENAARRVYSLKPAEGCEQPVAEEIKAQTGLFKELIEQLKVVNSAEYETDRKLGFILPGASGFSGQCHLFLPGIRPVPTHFRCPDHDFTSGLAERFQKNKCGSL
ncbi:MAG: hypothetical protein MZW92_12875 [Comamonadaceae bacterium]|nr:hypothetical protein [Comamonadaceae bacterium]